MRKPIPDHRFHRFNNNELLYVIKDAGEAAIAMRGVDYAAECKYLDQVNDAQTVLNYRRAVRNVKRVEA